MRTTRRASRCARTILQNTRASKAAPNWINPNGRDSNYTADERRLRLPALRAREFTTDRGVHGDTSIPLTCSGELRDRWDFLLTSTRMNAPVSRFLSPP